MPTRLGFHELPPRLHGVVRLAVEGKSNREIALELGLALHTVENYMSEIMSAAGVRRRTQLVALYVRNLDGERGKPP